MESIGAANWFTFVELGTVSQLEPRPDVSGFVCTCSRQPV